MDLNWAWVSACSCSNLASVIFGMKNHGYPSLYDLHIKISILTNESQYENAGIFPIF